MDRISRDGTIITTTTWELRVLDERGDTQDVDIYETRAEGLAAFRAAVADDGDARLILERHVRREPAHLVATPSEYKTVRSTI